MLYRRLIVHTPRLFALRRAEQRYHDAPHWEGVVILVFILFIMVGGLLYDAGRLVEDDIQGNERDFAPLARAGGRRARRPEPFHLRRPSARSDGGCTASTILVFLSLLPLTKHFHIITGDPQRVLRQAAAAQPRSGRWRSRTCRPPRWPRSTRRPRASSASPSLADLSWKQVLDAFSCTECGRCTAVCPATASGAPLAPRQLILDIRDRLYTSDEQTATPSR